jgi:LCP family protein required for cell wall assembly
VSSTGGDRYGGYGGPDRTRVLPVVEAPGPRPRRRRRTGRRLLVALLLLVLLLPLVLVAVAWWRIDKVDALVDGGRSDATVYLLVGSDAREGLTRQEQIDLKTGTQDIGRRTDTILLLSVPGDGGRPALVSVPRDSLVDIPGHGTDKVNAAFSLGGPRLLVQTLQQATGVHIDEYVEIGFGGFVGVVDALGSVRVCLDEPFADERTQLDLPAGCSSLDAGDSLRFVRARYGDPRADLGRVERQRQFLSAVSDRAASPSVLLNPYRLARLSWASGDALRVDASTYPWDLVRFALALRSVSGSGGDRLTVPIGSAGNTVTWDEAAAEELWSALREGRALPRALVEAAGS